MYVLTDRLYTYKRTGATDLMIFLLILNAGSPHKFMHGGGGEGAGAPGTALNRDCSDANANAPDGRRAARY